MQAANENLASVNNPNPTPLHSLNSCFQHCRLHRGQRGEKKKKKKNVVLVRADPGASAFSASRLGTAPTKRGHLDMHGPVVSRCSSCAVPGANTTRGDPRALPARGPDAENSAKHARTGCAALPPRDDALHAPHMLVLGGA
jgi:hypothetical protein